MTVDQELERLGESEAFSFTLVELLGRAGWSPAFVAPQFGHDPAGSHVLTAEKYGRTLRVAGPTRAEAVRKLLREISSIERLPVLTPADLCGEQLSLDELQSWEDWFAGLPARGQGS